MYLSGSLNINKKLEDKIQIIEEEEIIRSNYYKKFRFKFRKRIRIVQEINAIMEVENIITSTEVEQLSLYSNISREMYTAGINTK
jgi:thermostable 8-oxoguanine DNA glycosylase